jgi:small subunit ribosomal protein S3
MGQKVNPIGFRLGVIKEWQSKWYANKQNYAAMLEQDVKIRKYLKKQFVEALVDRIDIERSRKSVVINAHVAKPGLVIGRGGAGIEKVKKTIQQKFLPQKTNVQINVQEVKKPNLRAAIIVRQIANDLEKRVAFRRSIKQAAGRIEREGPKGYKIQVKGRLNGAEIARTEKISFGLIPLHTLRADVDYSRGVAHTTYGVIGIKVWVYNGEVFEKKKEVKKEIAPKTPVKETNKPKK